MDGTVKSRPLVGVAVVVCKNDKFLLGKRKNSHGAGCWQFPGGHLEFDESLEDCARREVFEETGITIRNIRFGPFTNDLFKPEQKHYITLFVVADHESGEETVKEPDKCECWGWFAPDDLPQPLFLPIRNLFKRNITLTDLIDRAHT
jgi:8-oxo-dGTP diphosphatase